MAQEVGEGLAQRKVLLDGVPRSSMTTIRYVAFDQLHEGFGVLRDCDQASDLVLLIESRAMITRTNWHRERLFFLISSARHFARRLRDAGYHVTYLTSPNTAAGLRTMMQRHPGVPVMGAEQSSFAQSARLRALGVTLIENDFFLTSPSIFSRWASQQSTLVLENFYRQQRVRLNLLMDGRHPVGGAWNFDKENRRPPPKNYSWRAPLEHERDDIDLEVAQELGMTPSTTWATTREGALAQLDDFIHHHLAHFGPYEDAVTSESWSLHHSVLSPYLNNGLLHPGEVLEQVSTSFETRSIPIASAEAFVRQIVGWREYVNGLYWFFGPGYREQNQLGATRDLLPLFEDPMTTQMKCVKATVVDVQARGWVHHIPRLMILSNLALLAGVNPQQFLEWMRRVFVDATEWVMVPNVIGMGVHADGGRMMTKPYAAGGAYLSRMTNYCSECVYNPKLRTGERACPFTTLYWDFLDRHQEEFATNHRMAQQLAGLRRLSDLPEVKTRARVVLRGLEQGLI